MKSFCSHVEMIKPSAHIKLWLKYKEKQSSYSTLHSIRSQKTFSNRSQFPQFLQSNFHLSISNVSCVQYSSHSFNTKSKSSDPSLSTSSSSVLADQTSEETWMSTVDISESQIERFKQEHKEITLKLKKFLLKVHPDLFHSFPEKRKINESSLKLMNHLSDAIKNFLLSGDPSAFNELDSPIKLQFMCKYGENEHDIIPLKANFFLPMHLLGTTDHVKVAPQILRFYAQCVEQLFRTLPKHCRP